MLDPWSLVQNPGTNYEGEWLATVQEWVEDKLEKKLHGDGLFSPFVPLEHSRLPFHQVSTLI